MRWKRAAGILTLTACIAAGAIVLWPSRQSDLRVFDPVAVARLETDMWRSYYDHKPLLLYRQLAELMQQQYGMSWFRAQVTAYHAAKAAVVFQRGHARPEYERALPDLVDYYAEIRSSSKNVFNIQEAARRELEWWIIHRERDRYGKDALIRSLAELQEALYQQPADRFREHAAARAEAMIIRDDRAAAGDVTQADWSRINHLLDQSWNSLRQNVRQ